MTRAYDVQHRAPFVRGSETSEAAADEIEEHGASMTTRVLNTLKAQPAGLTDQQMQDMSGLGPQSQCPRRIELVKLGLVADSGRKRKTRRGRDATVWVYTPKEGE